MNDADQSQRLIQAATELPMFLEIDDADHGTAYVLLRDALDKPPQRMAALKFANTLRRELIDEHEMLPRVIHILKHPHSAEAESVRRAFDEATRA
jgi:hypothetical protein